MVKLIYSDKTEDWIELPKNSKEGLYLDGFLWNTFYSAKNVMKRRDVDLPIAVTGYPGSGKSTITVQLASICDPTFTEKRMCQTTQSFLEEVKRASKGQAVVLDESFEGLNSSEIRKEVGRALLNLLNVIRQKRLYIFIVLPNYFDLSKNIAIFRTRWLIHCYSESFGDVGRFCAFDRHTKQKLYMIGKRFEDYNCVKADFYGVFTKEIPNNFNWETYLEMKEEALQNLFIERENVSKTTEQRNKLIYYLYSQLQHTTIQISELLDLTQRSIQLIIAKQVPK